MSDIELLSPQIAAELAVGLSTKEEICERYEITAEQWDILRQNPIFRNMVREAMQKFAGDLNSVKRTQIKAGILYEDLLPDLYTMARDNMIPANSRVEAIKILGKTAGTEAPEKLADGVAGAMFQININFSDDPARQLTIKGHNQAVLEHSGE